MTLADTSVFVHLLQTRPAAELDFASLVQVVTCPPVVQEVLQGLTSERPWPGLVPAILSLPVLSDPVPLALFRSAAEIYRAGRSRGYTIRSSMDCLIAAIAIEHQAPVWHRDRDFDIIARFTRLQVVRSIN